MDDREFVDETRRRHGEHQAAMDSAARMAERRYSVPARQRTIRLLGALLAICVLTLVSDDLGSQVTMVAMLSVAVVVAAVETSSA